MGNAVSEAWAFGLNLDFDSLFNVLSVSVRLFTLVRFSQWRGVGSQPVWFKRDWMKKLFFRSADCVPFISMCQHSSWCIRSKKRVKNVCLGGGLLDLELPCASIRLSTSISTRSWMVESSSVLSSQNCRLAFCCGFTCFLLFLLLFIVGFVFCCKIRMRMR